MLETTKAMLDKIPDDEPIFILRAQDAYTLDAIGAWFNRAVIGGVSPVKLIKAIHHIEAIRDYQKVNGVKIPD